MTSSDRLRLTSERLAIFPLTLEEFRLYVTNRAQFAARFRFSEPLDEHAPQTERALKNLFRLARLASPEEKFWRTLWIIESNPTSPANAPASPRVMLGHLCFHNPPKERAVEIAYTTETAARNRGVMTEAARLLLQALAARPDVDVVRAETASANLASARVLQKLGFQPDARRSARGYAQWRLELATLRRE